MVMWYLQRTNDYIVMYRRLNQLRSSVTLILISHDAKIVRDPYQAISNCLLEELFPGRVLSRHS